MKGQNRKFVVKIMLSMLDVTSGSSNRKVFTTLRTAQPLKDSKQNLKEDRHEPHESVSQKDRDLDNTG